MLRGFTLPSFTELFFCGKQTLQLLQMVGGMIVTYVAGSRNLAHGKGEGGCYTDPANYKLGGFMYFCYFVLFFVLFWDKYISKCKKESKEPAMCNAVEDAAGMFRADDYSTKDKQKPKQN